MASSSFPDAPATVRLRVSVDSPLAEVFLVDHAFALIERSVGDLEAAVEPGVYTVRARLGGEEVERLIILIADHSLNLSGQLQIASAAPLEGTSRTHEFHIDHAASGSGKTSRSGQPPPSALSVGSGAEMFLMARRWSSAMRPGGLPHAAPRTVPDLILRRPDGEIILDLTKSGTGEKLGWDPFLGCRVTVDPGAYILGWRAAGIAFAVLCWHYTWY